MADFTPKSITEAVVAKSLERLAPNGAISKRAGYSYINGSLIPNALSPILARAMRAGKVVREGVAKTEKFTADIDPSKHNHITVQLQTNTGVHTRTLRSGGIAGTPGNDGLINTNRKLVATTTPFDIPILEMQDQPWFFPQMMLETMYFDEVAETIANIADNEVNAMDAYDMAKMIAYACWRANTGSGDNILRINQTNAYDELYMVKQINALDALMSRGDPATNLGTFRGRRALLLRNELLGYIKTPKTGFIINTPRSNDFFWEPSFDENETVREGSQYRGGIRGYEMFEFNRTHQELIEKYLNLDAGTLDGVLGIVSTPLSYAGGGVAKKTMKLMQSTEYDGVVAFPYTKFGGAAYRQIFLIVDNSFTIPTQLATTLAPAPTKAPAKWDTDKTEPITRVLYDADGNPAGTEEIMSYLKPNGDTTCNVILTLVDSTGAPVKTATLTTTVGESSDFAYTNNMNGTYTVLIPKGQAASIAVTATGFTAATVSVTAKQSAQWQYVTKQTLTAASAG